MSTFYEVFRVDTLQAVSPRFTSFDAAWSYQYSELKGSKFLTAVRSVTNKD